MPIAEIRRALKSRRLVILQLLGVLSNSCVSEDKSEHHDVTGGLMRQADTGSPCEGSMALPDRPGYEVCKNGLVHRVAQASCEDTVVRRSDSTPDASAVPVGDAETAECKDENCLEREHGYCREYGFPLVTYVCAYGCTKDEQCDRGENCYCQAPVGSCTTANCNTDSDCGDGLLCAEYRDNSGCGHTPTYACQTLNDECAVDADCPTNAHCVPSAKGWECSFGESVCGRPFLIGDAARTAPLVEGPDRLRSAAVPLGGLSAAEREALGAHWAQIGLMEHASIAAFARFTLQLLQLGAPVELVAASAIAATDEAKHAELAFELATAYLSRPVGAGALRADDALSASSLQEVTRLVLHEGCVGETLAAMEATYALRHCKDAHVGMVLERIAKDEAAHSDLAWRFLRWALSVDPTLRDEVAAMRAALEKQMSPSGLRSESLSRLHERRLRSYGLVRARERLALRRRVIMSVIVPCLDAASCPRVAA